MATIMNTTKKKPTRASAAGTADAIMVESSSLGGIGGKLGRSWYGGGACGGDGGGGGHGEFGAHRGVNFRICAL